MNEILCTTENDVRSSASEAVFSFACAVRFYSYRAYFFTR